jgi:hypothetical protein
VSELVDLFVDVGVFGDVGVGAGDVRLRLKVVVVGDEVLDGVVREQLLELTPKLGRQRLIVGEHQRGTLQSFDDVRHHEGLTRAGGAEQRLVAVALT